MPIRPRRSVLYMPGSNRSALAKARTLAADALVFDLEDSVGSDKKELARVQVIEAVDSGEYGERELVIRINGINTTWWEDDVISVAGSKAHAICLPKVETATEIDTVVNKLNDNKAPEYLDIWVMIETPIGVLNIHQIASHPRVKVVAMGTTDLAKELRVPHTTDRLGLLTSLSHSVLAARACDVEILDGVYLDLDDPDGFERICQQGRNLGFDGKTLIHPKQLTIANRCFSPSDEELIRAGKIIKAWACAQAEGKGVVLVDGKLVEKMHIDEAKRNLEIAKVIVQLEHDK